MKYSSKERRNRILEELHQQSRVSIRECAEKYGVTEVSIRTDLEYLENKGLLIRVKGGAVSRTLVADEEELPIESKAREHAREKKAIGTRESAAMFFAIERANEVLPIAGRPAIITRSEACQPLVRSSSL